MDYISTRGRSPAVDSAQAVLQGLAPDGGLYVPRALPEFDWRQCLKLSRPSSPPCFRTFPTWGSW